MSIDTRSQGGKANDAGDSALETIAIHLETHARLQPIRAARIREYRAAALGGLFPEATGDFACNVRVADCGTWDEPVEAQFVIRRRGWPFPLALFVNSQTAPGSAADKLIRKIHDMQTVCEVPSALVLLGGYWEQPGLRKVRWLRRQVGSRAGKLLKIVVGLAELRDWITAGMPWPDGQSTLPL